jgi:hypothetical protein
MEAVEEWARSRGAVIALVDTYIKSPLSMPFYEQRMGYSRGCCASARRSCDLASAYEA